MRQVHSKTGSQLVEIEESGSGVVIRTVDVRKGYRKSVHIFYECVPDLIKHLEEIKEKQKITKEEAQ